MNWKSDRHVGSAVVACGLLVMAVFVLATLPGAAAGPWYVEQGGDDGNDCLSPATACATINGALAKASSGDTIYVATGTYTGTGDQVVLLDRDATLSGGWNDDFAVQDGISRIDGQDTRRGIVVEAAVAAIAERFSMENGYHFSSGGAVLNLGSLTLEGCEVSGSSTPDYAGGIDNQGTLVLDRSGVSGNLAYDGGGIGNSGALTLTNSTVGRNSASDSAGGILNQGTASLHSSTVSANLAGSSAGGILNAYGGATVALQNTILAGNTASGAASDCWGPIDSTGYNLVGTTTGCDFVPGPYDQTGVEAKLGRLEGSPAHYPLLPYGPAIDAGSCTGVSTDQRGQPRPVDHAPIGTVDDGCDVGAYELQALGLSFKGSQPNPVTTGDPVAFTIHLSNSVSSNATTAEVTDALPALLTYVDGSLSATGGECGYSNGVITWTGTVAYGAPESVSFAATVSRTASGDGITNTVVISGGGDIITRSRRIGLSYRVHLPCLLRGYCPELFFDDFSDPGSGWAVVDDEYVRSEYLNGEYRILTKQSGYWFLFSAPTCDRHNYIVEVDARWEGAPGNGYGLIFSVTPGFEQYYLYDMNTDYQMWRLYRRDAEGFTELHAPSYSSAINPGAATNHIEVKRWGESITLKVNGTMLGYHSDDTITGLTSPGLVVSAYSSDPSADARFDNYRITALPGSGALAGSAASHGPTSQRVRLPTEAEWQ